MKSLVTHKDHQKLYPRKQIAKNHISMLKKHSNNCFRRGLKMQQIIHRINRQFNLQALQYNRTICQRK